MSDVTKILTVIESGVQKAAYELLPLVYQELRKLASAKLSQEKPGQTIQPTMLVHETLTRFEQQWPDKAKLVKLKYFAALTIPEASKATAISCWYSNHL